MGRSDKESLLLDGPAAKGFELYLTCTRYMYKQLYLSSLKVSVILPSFQSEQLVPGYGGPGYGGPEQALRSISREA